MGLASLALLIWSHFVLLCWLQYIDQRNRVAGLRNVLDKVRNEKARIQVSTPSLHMDFEVKQRAGWLADDCLGVAGSSL